MYTPINVELVKSMGDDLTIANVARVSFDNWKEVKDASDDKLIKYLAKHRHTTPFRHPHVMLRCKAPIALARQLGKHQVGMQWNEVSRRYVKENFEFFSPEVWRQKPAGHIKQGSADEAVPDFWKEKVIAGSSGAVLTSVEAEYQAAVQQCLRTYETLLSAGVAPEQARFVLPQGMQTSWIWTGSLLGFAHVYNLRSDYDHAQKDLREFCEKLNAIMTELFPVAWPVLTKE